jgi:hypothetical protein
MHRTPLIIQRKLLPKGNRILTLRTKCGMMIIQGDGMKAN